MNPCSHPKMYVTEGVGEKFWCCRDCSYTKKFDRANGAGDPVPWWFKKLVDAETKWFAEKRKAQGFWETDIDRDWRNTGLLPETQHERMSIGEKLHFHGIVQEPGDVEASAVLAMAKVITPVPVPKLGSFMRDPENPQSYERFGE